MKKTKLKAVRIYNGEERLEDLLLSIIKKELESKFDELYNQTQADTVIHNKEGWVA